METARNPIEGDWLDPDCRVLARVETDSGRYHATLAEGLENGERDEANADPALRSRPLLGIRLFEGLEDRGAGRYRGGSIYDPNSGREYRLQARLAAPDRLELRAYAGIPALGRTMTFRRAGRIFPEPADIDAEAGLDHAPPRWDTERALAWAAARPWTLGCNFIPSYAANQIEHWSAARFDEALIGRELDLAASLGMNAARVYLHDRAYAADPSGFLDRVRRHLDLAGRLGIATLFVLFDDCWNDWPGLRRLPMVRKGVHNSAWLKSPGTRAVDDEDDWPRLEAYARGVVGSFREDLRIMGWDVWNEVGNFGALRPNTTRLLARAFRWVREERPIQPLCSGVWKRSSWWEPLNRFILGASDLASFHNYAPPAELEAEIDWIESVEPGRPVLCTEYMARTQGSSFAACLPVLARRGVGAFNWGLVDGRTQTKYPWGGRPGAKEPELWFHDVFRSDLMPYDTSETDLIRSIAREYGTHGSRAAPPTRADTLA
ncbi:MAG: DUF2147 domain-containing protein [Spirochaetales bacterium]|nr:DUF2147 domain-containing protein [Spirochaetales bacterium]